MWSASALKPDDAEQDGVPAADHGRAPFNARNARADRRRHRGGPAARQRRRPRLPASSPRRRCRRCSRCIGLSPAVPRAGCPARPLPARLAGGQGRAGRAGRCSWTRLCRGRCRQPLFATPGRQPAVPVAPGRYVVEARDGPVSASETVVVGEHGPTPVDLVLNAGTLRVQGAGAEDRGAAGRCHHHRSATPARAPRARKDAAAGPPVAVFKGSEAALPCRPAATSCASSRGWCAPSGPWWCRPAARARIDIAFNAARLLLSASAATAGGPTDAVIFSVVEDDPDAPKGRREVARSAARQADFVLPPGTYYVIARQGSVEARERLARRPRRRGAAHAARWRRGRLALATKPLGRRRQPGEPVSYRVERLDGPAPEVITTSRPAPVLLLAGRPLSRGRPLRRHERAQRARGRGQRRARRSS